MTAGWPGVHLGAILRRSKEAVELQPEAQYRELTVRLWGKGVVLRGMVAGAEVAASRRMVARRGQLIVSRIDARNGALGIVPDELDGAIVSSDFPAFDFASDIVEPAYFGWMCRSAPFIRECQHASEGTTNRVRLQEDRFLAIEIPLPSLIEQQQLVARIEELATEIVTARSLRQQASDELERMVTAEELRLWSSEMLADAPTLVSLTSFLARGRQSEQGESEHFLVKTQHVQQARYVATRLRLAPHAAMKVHPTAILRNRDILIACSAAGCLGRVAQYMSDGHVASTDTHVAVARPEPSVVEPDYLYAYLRSAQGQHQLRSRERGNWEREKIGFRLTELNLNDLRAVPVPLPSGCEQRRIVTRLNALQLHVDTLKRLGAETAAELGALLPAILDRAFKGELMR